MAAADCAAQIKEVLGEDITGKQLDEVMELLNRRARTKQRNDGTLDEEQAFAAAADELAAERRLADLIEKRSRAINVMRKRMRENFYEANAPLGRAGAIHALNVGAEGKGYGLGRSVDAQHQGIEANQLLGPMIADLRRKGVMKVAQRGDPTLERDTAREMARLNGRDDIEPTGNETAAAMAEVFVKYTEYGRTLQNEAGAWIRKLPGYITRQNHDQMKIYKAGFEAWRQKIEPLLDERTFDDLDGPEEVTEFLRGAYNNLATGNHLKAQGDSDWLGGFKGPGNLAKRASAERTLHFKGPDEWMNYNDEFGRSSLFESVINGMSFSARNTALLRTWGTNPEAAMRADLDQAIVAAKGENNLDEVSRLNNWKMQAQMDQITNATHVPGNIRLAAVSSSIRAVQSLSKLGGVVLSSIPDVAFRASTLRHNGVPLTESYSRSMMAMLEGRKGTEKREIGDLMGAGIQGVLGGAFERFHATDNVPGRMSKLQNLFFRVNGLTAWTDAMGRGVGLMLSRNLANQIKAGKAFSNLDSKLQTTLRRYGIDEAEWDLVAKSDLRVADGEDFLVADAIRGLDDETIRGYMGKPDAGKAAVKAAREDLETRLSTYFSDQVRESLTFAGARERSLQTMGSAAGTPLGEGIRFLMQFKTFPITFVTKHLNREFRRDGFDAGGMANLIAASTILGFAAMNAKEIAKGRTPRTPEDSAEAASIMKAAMLQGGGLGIYGDFLFGESNRFGGGLVSTMAGPTGSTIDEFARVLHAARDGEDPRAKALRAGQGVTPFANLFYTRVALDYLVMWRLQEAINPGYLRRYERTIERENGNDFWLEPTSAD